MVEYGLMLVNSVVGAVSSAANDDLGVFVLVFVAFLALVLPRQVTIGAIFGLALGFLVSLFGLSEVPPEMLFGAALIGAVIGFAIYR